MLYHYERSPLANPNSLHNEHAVAYATHMFGKTAKNRRENEKWCMKLHDEIWQHITPEEMQRLAVVH